MFYRRSISSEFVKFMCTLEYQKSSRSPVRASLTCNLCLTKLLARKFRAMYPKRGNFRQNTLKTHKQSYKKKKLNIERFSNYDNQIASAVEKRRHLEFSSVATVNFHHFLRHKRYKYASRWKIRENYVTIERLNVIAIIVIIQLR